MTDDCGLTRHAKYATPNRFEGYYRDDNNLGSVTVLRRYRRLLRRPDGARPQPKPGGGQPVGLPRQPGRYRGAAAGAKQGTWEQRCYPAENARCVRPRLGEPQTPPASIVPYGVAFGFGIDRAPVRRPTRYGEL